MKRGRLLRNSPLSQSADHQVVAVKEMTTLRHLKKEDIYTEINLLCSCSSPNIVQCFGSFRDETSICLVMECMDGSLEDVRNVPMPVLAMILHDVISGLAYLHDEKRLLHNDLKPANLLFKRGKVKLSDFGTAVPLGRDGSAKEFVGSVSYMSPERIEHEPCGPEADVWSLGILALELATGQHPLKPVMRGKLSTEEKFWAVHDFFRSSNGPLAQYESLDPLFADFAQQCLSRDKFARPTSRALLTHDFLKQYLMEPATNLDTVHQWLLQQQQADCAW